jgi:hypothetical protein
MIKRILEFRVLAWRDQSGICFKFGRAYGGGCWETYLPKRRPFYYVIPIFKTDNVK